MRTNKLTTYALLLGSLATAFIYTSCNKHACPDGELILYPFSGIEIRDGQNKNLLDPATPGHYDTAYIKRSNTWCRVSQPHMLPVQIVFDLVGAEGSHTLNLSNTDQGTVNISVEHNVDKCGSSKLLGMQYNNTALTADPAQTTVYYIYK